MARRDFRPKDKAEKPKPAGGRGSKGGAGPSRGGRPSASSQDDGQRKLGTTIARSGRDGLAAQVTPLWSQTGLPKLEAAPPSSEKQRRKAKAANLAVQHAALSDEHIASLNERANRLLERENELYAQMFEAEATGNATAKTSLAAAGSNISASDARFIRTLLSTSGEGGTLSDRISALTLMLQSSPLHNLRTLESLMAMVRKKNREESGRASRALSDWFASASGLPGDRKLRYFQDQPGLADVAFVLSNAEQEKNTVAAAEQHLLLFAFEHRLKTTFFEFLLLLEARSHDMLAFARSSSVVQISNLLSAKPEQEQNLLRLLVNKLGDGERSVASKASNALLHLLNNHPGMKNIVVREVADLILKPPASLGTQKSEGSNGASPDGKKYNTHARYYGVLTLNQTMITNKDRQTGLSNALVNLYFELFEGILEDMDSGKKGKRGLAGKEDKLGAGGEAEDEDEGDSSDDEAAKKPKQKNRWRDQGGKRKKGGKPGRSSQGGKEVNAVIKDAESKIIAALLTGVRRAMPFATLETAVFERHIETLFRITHSGTFNISIQALQLIFQVCTSSSSTSAGTSSKTESGFTTSVALTDRYYRTLYASLIDPRLEETSKQAMYLNLLYRSMKVDVLAAQHGGESQVERLKAFAKRLLQVLGHHQPPFACGALFMLGELCKLNDALREMLTEPASSGAEAATGQKEGDEAEGTEKTKFPIGYDGTKRDPKFAQAGTVCLWELLPLVSHYHPSVALHAQQLLEGTPITANADLNTSSLSHFLDRFVFRNPKLKAPAAKGASIMQPGFGGGTGSLDAGIGADDVNVTRLKGQGVSKDEDVTNPKFWKRKREDVPVDQIFFHQYFQQKHVRESGGDVKAKDGGLDDNAEEDGETGPSGPVKNEDDDGEVLDEDEVDDEEIWQAIMDALPESGDVDNLVDSDSSDGDDAGFVGDQGSDDGSDAIGFDADDFSEDEELEAMLGRRGAVQDGDSDEDDDDEDSFADALLQEDDDDDDDEDVGLEVDDSDDDAEDEAVEGADVAADEEDDADDDDSIDVELFEDDDDLISLDGEDESDDGDEVAAPAAPAVKPKRKRGQEDEDDVPADGKPSNRERRQERKKRKALPTFASADDYAHLLASDDEGN
ncbi:hypothetical protein V8E36_003395 [Tilletia maclaganii]